MRYAQIREMDVSNGEGLGISLFVQGCHFRCKGCFNQETWDFSGGKKWDDRVEDDFMRLLERPYVKRVSILGGEPLADENAAGVLWLIERIKHEHPGKQIWLYTGYTFETIVEVMNGDGREYTFDEFFRFMAATGVDVLVDGPFMIDKQDVNHRVAIFAGSTNQRMIDIKATMEKCENGFDCSPVLYERKYNGNQN